MSLAVARTDQRDRQWWRADEGREHELLFPVVDRLRVQDGSRRERVLKHIKMYGGLGPSISPRDTRPDRLRYNVCKQGADTLLAEISSSKPKAAILTQGGDWTLRQAAKNREMVVEAQMRDAGIYSGLARQVLRDAEVTGIGIGQVYIDWETLTPKIDRVLPNELLVDEADGRYGKPRMLVRQRLIDRGVLLERHGDTAQRREAIRDAKRFSANEHADEWLLSTSDLTESDLVLVVEAWRLPSSPSAEDGKHVVAIDTCTLETEPYARDRFPLIILRWSEELVGFFGQGVVGEMEPDQVELNRTLRRIQEAAGVAAGVWLLERAARVRQTHLTDMPGACIEYTGIKPDYYQPNTVVTDLVAHADRIIQRVLNRLGVSEMFAAALKPAGLNSGEAQRVHADVFSRRQIEHVQAYEQWHVDVARAFVDANEDILAFCQGETKRGKGKELPAVSVSVKRGRRTVLKRLRFDEANLPENCWVMQAFPMSSLPTEPSGRQATISEWMQGDLIDLTTAKSLLQIPDTESAMDLQLADFDFALWAFETMVEDGEYISPEPFQKLDQALELMRVSYLRALIDGVPDERLDLVRDHMDAIKRLIKKATAPQLPAVDPAMAAADPAMAAPAPELAGIDPNTLPVAA